MNHLNRGPSIDASYQVSVLLLSSFTERAFFLINHQKQELPVAAMPPQAIIFSDWSISKKSSLKPPGQMNRNMVSSIYGMSSIKIGHLVPIRLQTWPIQSILASD
jgi:hypothetical protein